MNKLFYYLLSVAVTSIVVLIGQFLLAYLIGYFTDPGSAGFNPFSAYLFIFLYIPALLASLFISYKLMQMYSSKVKDTKLAVKNPLPFFIFSVVTGLLLILVISEILIQGA